MRRDIRTDLSGLPNAEMRARQCLSVPCHAWMADGEVEQAIDALNSFA
jgi:dTDP-4-amino-4,6-dideoxygalactose transaminase